MYPQTKEAIRVATELTTDENGNRVGTFTHKTKNRTDQSPWPYLEIRIFSDLLYEERLDKGGKIIQDYFQQQIPACTGVYAKAYIKGSRNVIGNNLTLKGLMIHVKL